MTSLARVLIFGFCICALCLPSSAGIDDQRAPVPVPETLLAANSLATDCDAGRGAREGCIRCESNCG
jgi:hypothetical protein